jgi:uncharacterized protein YdeI (BOF family)
MRFMKRNLFDLSILGAMALALVLAWGSPSAGAGFGHIQAQERPTQQSEQAQDQAATFAGTVVKDGEHYDLRDSSGEVFKLDDAERVKPFAGKTVKVTGELDAQAKVIHVESIEAAEG